MGNTLAEDLLDDPHAPSGFLLAHAVLVSFEDKRATVGLSKILQHNDRFLTATSASNDTFSSFADVIDLSISIRTPPQPLQARRHLR